MMPIRRGLLSLAIHDEAVFHSCLSQYAASYNVRFHAGDPIESIQHRTQGIRLLNERLRDPNERLSDGTIAAIANIAIYESANGSISSIEVHLNGLEQIINMRGGIHKGNFAPFVQRLLAWCDLHCAIALSQPPRFPPLDIPLASNSTSLPTASNPSTIQKPINSGQSTITIDSIIDTLHFLSSTLQQINPEQPPDIWYSDQVYAVQRHLSKLSHSPASTAPQLLDKSTAIAALIFSYAALRDIPFNFRVVGTMVTMLKAVLMELCIALDTHAFVARCLAVGKQRMFWATALGGMAAKGRQEYPWFVKQLAGAGSWEAMKVRLEEVLWKEELDDRGKAFWVDVVVGGLQNRT